MNEAAPQPLQLALLGPYTLRAGDEIISISGDKTRALLAYLAIEPGQEQRRDRLMALLWPDLPLDQAQANLRQTVLRLRRALPPVPDRHTGKTIELILSTRAAVGIDPQAAFDVDARIFRQRIDGSRSHDHPSLTRCPTCRDRLEAAVKLYHDDFLSDLYIADSSEFEAWSASQRASFRQDLLESLDKLANLHMAQGNFSLAEPLARRQIVIDPLRESAYRQLMTLLARSGRKAEALSVYESCRKHLAEELGVDPAPATRALHESILFEELEESAAPVDLKAFTLQDEIARGAFGAVYRAHQPSVNREVAIKVIAPEVASNPDFVRRLETEARIVARLEHPHIVPIYAFWSDDSGAYLVMRLLHGGSLKEMLAQGPLSKEICLHLLDQITSALAVVHEHGVVHRDLKPGNILLDEYRNAYLSDFGIAKDLGGDGRQTLERGFLGSPAYMAPEQINEEPVTPRTDIYSLGIILYEMLTGAQPFVGKSLPHLLQSQLNEPLPSLSECLPDVPRAVDLVLARATAKRPEDRYPDVMSLATDFKQALAGGMARVEITESAGHDSLVRGEPPGLADVPLQRPFFVARETQLAELSSRLARAREDEGQVICITGGAGRGKSALLAEFARRAMEAEPQLIVAMGSCHSYSAAGAPYLPFREILAVLTADVEARLRAGVISPGHARRLWTNLPDSIRALVEHGPDLIGSLLPAGSLLTRARSAAPVDAAWLADLSALAARPAIDDDQEPDPNRLFSQVTAVFQALSEKAPLLLILDDLQWVDKASAALLFHLSRQLGGRRMMLACAYRADEVILGRDGERHPLDKVLAEIKREFGPAWIDLAELDEQEGLSFVNALLDSEPNKLDHAFRQALYAHTSGHPLFTVELLRTLKDRGELVRDAQNDWITSSELAWNTLPPRVEGVIEERIARLPLALQNLLSAASVEGELFTAQVVSHVEGLDEQQTWRVLSRELQRIHNLIREQEELRVGGTYLTRYRFKHTMYQQFLYGRLGRGERRSYHRRVGESLRETVADQWQPFAGDLARHFREAGQPDQALPYWIFLGDQARISYAHTEAEQFYEAAISELSRQNKQEEAARTLMKLGLVYTAAFQPQKAQQAYARAFMLWEPALNVAGSQPSAQQGAVLRLALEPPATLDPGLIDDDVSTFMAAQLFEGLVRVGDEHNILPAAAQRWQVLENGTVYQLVLRSNLRWNDGQMLTAHDFVFAWRRNLRKETASPSGHLLYILKSGREFAEGSLTDANLLGVEAVDDRTLRVTLAYPAAYFPYLLAHTVTFPQPEHALKQYQSDWTHPGNLVSNGPFELARDASQERFQLLRSETFGERFTGNIERMECTIFPDYEAALDAFGRDELDAVSLLNASPEVKLSARARFGAQVLTIPRPSVLYINFHCGQAPFADRRVRQAFTLAIDKAQLVRTAFQGLRQPASGGFIPPGVFGHSPDIAPAFNPLLAQQLLADAGYPAGRGFPAISWVSPPGGEQVLAFLRSAWKEHLGLDLPPTTEDFAVVLRSFDANPAELTLLGWGVDFPDPVNVLRAPFHSEGSHNFPRWQNADFDDLTDRAERVIDNKERLDLYRRADAILVADECAVLPLTYAEGSILAKPWIHAPETLSITMALNATEVRRPG